jgi:exosortase
LGERVNQEIKRPEKELISPNDSDVKLRSARNGGVDRSSWTYPSVSTRGVLWFLGVSALVLLWSYWPTLRYLANAWWNEPDYSHGLFVVPIVGYLLWNNKDTKPPFHAGVHVGGLIMLGTVVLLRLLGAFAFIDSIDGWTLPLIAIALAWVVGGKGVVRWALPALIFLFFMIPLPFRIENELSRPLQVVATKASTFTLQLLGQPAISEGTTILLGEQVLEVERACSGLRIFFGVFALAYIYAMLYARTIWEGGVIVLAAIPIALIANMSRIVITGLCYQRLSGEWAKTFSHDMAGYFMILLAGGLFFLLVRYLRALIQDAQTLDQVALRRA